MKKLLVSIVSLLAFAIMANCQDTIPRFGTTAGNDNTGRVITYAYTHYLTTSATAVLYQKPHCSVTIYKIDSLRHALTDSLSVSRAKLGDRVTFIFACDSLTAGRVVTFGNHIKSAGTLTVTKKKKATATFIFDGVAWIEENRAICTN